MDKDKDYEKRRETKKVNNKEPHQMFIKHVWQWSPASSPLQ